MENGTKTQRPDGKGWVWDEENKKWFRIRKLTPRECFRLMDVKESDIDRLMAVGDDGKQVISNSQLYKCAGNSIVVACMYHLFSQLWYPEGEREEGIQLTLF